MLSKSLISILALTSAVSASPLLRREATGSCVDKYNTCRTTPVDGLSANQSKCAADNAACKDTCKTAYNTCRTTPQDGLSANQAQCAAEYAGCLGENPFASSSSSSSSASATPTTTTVAVSTTPAVAATPAATGYSDPKKVDGKTWTLNNVVRYCGDGNKGCDYNFDIVANGKTEHCTIIRSPGSNAATESFSNQSCGDYTVSWGYVEKPAPAFAVVTVADKAGELAWFGVSNVNGQATSASNPFGSGTFGNIGPEQVYTYN